jgi:hypothetical protein
VEGRRKIRIKTNDTKGRKVNLEKVEIRKGGPVSLECSETGFFELLKV